MKRELISRKIYIPTLWPGVDGFSELNDFERRLIRDLVLLPIDQRYDTEDMRYIARTVLQIKEKQNDYRCEQCDSAGN